MTDRDEGEALAVPDRPLPTPADSVPDRIAWATALAESDILPDVYRSRPANILYALELGDALGVPRITAINEINVIKGKPTISAALMRALVMQAGHRFRVLENSAEVCTVEVTRADDPEHTTAVTWTAEKARRAGLGGQAYDRYPAAMLLARASSEAIRAACPDVLAGTYAPEDMAAAQPEHFTRPPEPDTALDTPGPVAASLVDRAEQLGDKHGNPDLDPGPIPGDDAEVPPAWQVLYNRVETLTDAEKGRLGRWAGDNDVGKTPDTGDADDIERLHRQVDLIEVDR
jgi:hypothetical protein